MTAWKNLLLAVGLTDPGFDTVALELTAWKNLLLAVGSIRLLSNTAWRTLSDGERASTLGHGRQTLV